MLTSRNIAAKLFTALGTALVVACIIATHAPAHHAPLGTPPHCLYGEAHALGLPAQCAMPHPVDRSNVS